MLLECYLIRKGERFRGENFTLKVGQKGSMQIDVGKDFYIVESSFSHPGERMGINFLSERETESEPYWKPKVRKINRNEIEVQAQGRFYTLKRRVRLEKTRIKVEDALTNLRDTLTGIIVQNQITAPQAFKESYLGGAKESEVKMSAENPTIFISQEESSLGLIAEDNILRLQFEAISLTNNVNFAVRHF